MPVKNQQDISVFGMVAIVRASFTAPQGITLSSFSDDTSMISAASLAIAADVVTANGEPYFYAKVGNIEKVISVIADSDEDKGLAAIWNANRPEFGRRIAKDEITLTITDALGVQTTYSKGRMIAGFEGTDYGNDGKKKTKTYAFKFGSKTPAEGV